MRKSRFPEAQMIGVMLERKAMIMKLLPDRVSRSDLPRRHKNLYRLYRE